MFSGAVILPPVCELEHNCTPRQAHAILDAYIWCGVGLGVIVAVWAVIGFIDWRRRNRW